MKLPIFSSEGDTTADVVIVGSGVVGAMIADQLVSQGYSVLMLEAGLRIERAQAVENWRNMPFESRVGSDFQGLYPQAPNAPAPLYFPKNNYIALSGPDGNGFQQGYLRTVGGTTWHWAASCWRHLPVDLKMKSTYGVGRDWPISYEELEPYYCRAKKKWAWPDQMMRACNRRASAVNRIRWTWCRGAMATSVLPKWSMPTATTQYRFRRDAAHVRGKAVRPAAATTIASRSARSARCTTASITSSGPR